MKIGGIRLGLYGIRLDQSNKENFNCEYLIDYLLGWLFCEMPKIKMILWYDNVIWNMINIMAI